MQEPSYVQETARGYDSVSPGQLRGWNRLLSRVASWGKLPSSIALRLMWKVWDVQDPGAIVRLLSRAQKMERGQLFSLGEPTRSAAIARKILQGKEGVPETGGGIRSCASLSSTRIPREIWDKIAEILGDSLAEEMAQRLSTTGKEGLKSSCFPTNARGYLDAYERKHPGDSQNPNIEKLRGALRAFETPETR